jgi:hypothetical protein
MPPQLLARCADYSTGYGNRIQNRPHNYRGSAIAQGSKVIQRVASSWRTQDPIEGGQHPQALYLSLGWEVSFITLHVG